jgi:hypothetical protein
MTTPPIPSLSIDTIPYPPDTPDCTRRYGQCFQSRGTSITLFHCANLYCETVDLLCCRVLSDILKYNLLQTVKPHRNGREKKE